MKRYILSFIFLLIAFSGCASKNTEITIQKDLHYAVRVNDMVLVNKLINVSDLEKKDEYGYTPLHIASKFNHFDIAKLLISKGAEVNTLDKYFDTPLLDSVKKGYTLMSELLVCNGAKVKAKDERGVSVYEHALKSNDTRTAKLLSSKNIQQRCLGKVITPKKVSTSQFYNQISIDEYDILKTNKPTICGNVHDQDVKRVQISFDSGETVFEANINGKRWCAKVDKELINGYYRVDAISVNSINEKGLTSEELEIKAINSLAAHIKKEFGNDFAKWNANFNESNLSIVFNDSKGVFQRGSNSLSGKYKKIYLEFFPKYLEILLKYKKDIEKIYINVHTSSSYRTAKTEEERFEKNMILSEKRAKVIFSYLNSLLDERVIENEAFINTFFQARGKSSSELVLDKDGFENQELSRRVEFKIIKK